MTKHIITTKYDEMKNLFTSSPLNEEITEKFQQINHFCSIEVQKMTPIPITSRTTAANKNYVVFSLDKPNGNVKYSRPVNYDLYREGCKNTDTGTPVIQEFWNHVKSHQICEYS